MGVSALNLFYRKKIYTFLLSISLVCVFILSTQVIAATPRENISNTANSGNIIIGVDGMDVTSDEKALLDLINAARKSACDNGEPDPRDSSRKLNSSDYVPLKIGLNCRRAAQIRACEASLKMAHKRPDDHYAQSEECLYILKNLYSENTGWAENLAWDSTVGSSVDLWLAEREAYLGHEIGQTGHYATIINPDYKYTGMATFNPTNDSNEYDWACTAGQYAIKDKDVDSFETAKSENVIQKIEVPVSSVTGAAIPGDSIMKKGGQADISLLVGVKFSTEVSTNSVIQCPVYDGVTWTTSNASVLSINDAGHIVAKSDGKSTITAYIGTGTGVISVSKDYVIADATVSSIEEPLTITVESDKKPELPVTVKAHLSNGETADVAVSWNSYDESKLLTYFESRDFVITGTAGGKNVIQKIHVNAAVMTGTYTVPSVVTTEPGVKPTYPKANVGMSNGYAFTDIDVIWEEESLKYYKNEDGGTFTMKGKTQYEFQTDEGKKQFDVKLTLVVKSPHAEPEPPIEEVIHPGGSEEGGMESTGEGGSESTGGSNSHSTGESPADKPVPTPQNPDKTTTPDTDNGNNNSIKTPISVGEKTKIGEVSYQVTSIVDSGSADYSGEVAYSVCGKNAKTADIPAQITIDGKKYRVTSIGKNAFKGNKKLTGVTIGKYVTTIGENAFFNCSKLKKITFKGTSVKKIGKNAFKGVSKKAVAKVQKKVKKRYKKLLKKAKYKGKLG